MPFTVKLMRSPIGVDFEVGSISEALGILQDNKEKMRELLEFSSELGGGQDDTVTTTITPSGGSEQTGEAPAGKRGRGKGKAAAEAVAPAPIPVPDAAPPTPPAPAAPVDTTPNANGIPAFLDRTAPAAAAPPPPPLLPSAPPVAPPAATPAFILGNKIADDLQKRLDGSADKGAALQAWLMPYATGFAIPTATIDEVIAVIRFTADDKVAHLAQPLGIS